MTSTFRVAFALTSSAFVAGASAQAPPPNWTVTYRTNIDSGGGRTISSTVRFQVAGRKTRMEIKEASDPMGAAAVGVYMIAEESDSTVIAVVPGQKMAMTMNTPSLLAHEFIQKHYAVGDFAVDRVEDLGAAEALLAHPTHRYRVTQSSTTKLTLPGQACSRRQTTSTEMWMASGLDAAPVFVTLTQRFSGGNSDPIVDAMFVSPGAGMPRGTPLRVVSTTVGSDRSGSGKKVVTTFEVTELSTAPIDSSVFVVPAGFQTMDMRTMMPPMPRATMDSVVEATLLKSMEGSCAPRKDP